jgi:hypothetical protein
MSAWSINIVSVYINVQCITFMFNCIVSANIVSVYILSANIVSVYIVSANIVSVYIVSTNIVSVYIVSANIVSVYIVSTNIVSIFINVQCIIFMYNYIVSTILTCSTSSVPVHNDGFKE